MTQQNFETLRTNVANQSRPGKPLTGFYVSTNATGSNAAATDIVRLPARNAAR